MVTTNDGLPPTVANVMAISTEVLVATVQSIQGGEWNTKDGKQPVNGIRGGGNYNPQIVTPVDLRVDETLVSGANRGAIRVLNAGGTAGCVEQHVYPSHDLAEGRTYAFFLQPSSDADGARHPELSFVLEAWPIDQSGTVVTPEDGTLTLRELKSLVATPVQRPASPEPTPAGTDEPG